MRLRNLIDRIESGEVRKRCLRLPHQDPNLIDRIERVPSSLFRDIIKRYSNLIDRIERASLRSTATLFVPCTRNLIDRIESQASPRPSVLAPLRGVRRI
jgi:hypothetical protein